ncbi:MAG: cation:H+ antiporter [Miltoncostaeaceae bacterium]|nr:cation:H+ antiporter [Miltoncostaeaceae bacterium]
MSAFLLAVSFAILLLGAIVFTNAVEWLGVKLRLGQGVVGSLLAAVGTALPESLIAVVAIIAGDHDSGEVAVGAILGAPFLLATIAMALVGVAAIAFRRRRPQGTALEAHGPTLQRDLGFFLGVFGVGVALGLGAPRELQIAGAVGLVLAYVEYVRRTLRRGGAVQSEHTLKPLFLDPARRADPPTWLTAGQLAVALGAIVGGAHLFVGQLLTVAEQLGVGPLVLSLVLAPFATELPEKANSVIWMREGKDTLALGNITGAMVFQSTLPVALGLAFTDWELDTPSILAACLALAGGLLAFWALRLRRRFELPAVLGWAALYAVFVVYVIVAA